MKTIQHKGVKYYRVQLLDRDNACNGCVFDDGSNCPIWHKGKGTHEELYKCIKPEDSDKKPWQRMDDIFIEATPEALAQYVEQRLT